MKYLLIRILFISTLFSNPEKVFTQEFSETSKIENFSRIWGFLKYYHPAINRENIDWDSTYLKITSEIIETNTTSYNKILSQLIDNLGVIDTCESCENIERYPEEWKRNFEITWIMNDSMLSKSCKERLINIFDNRYQGEGNNCSYTWGVNVKAGTIDFKNEKNYNDSLLINDYRYRLLTLARFWNAIEYFYAYKYLLSNDWDSVLLKYIPIFKNPSTLEDYHLNVIRMIHEIEDTHAGTGHSRYLLKNKWNRKFPFDIITIQGKILVSEIRFPVLNEINNIEIGDEILEINGKPINRNEMWDLCKGSNENITNRSIDAQLLFGNTDKVNAKIKRNGIIIETEITRYPFSSFWNYPFTKKPSLIIKRNYSIINLGSITRETVDSIMNIAIKSNAIIFDLRDYMDISYYDIREFMNNESKPFFRAYEPSLIDIGIFKPVIIEHYENKNTNPYKGKIIVIVNEFTQSKGEFLAMFFQSLPNTIIIGSQTAGTDGTITQILLPGNINANFTNIIIEYPDGSQSQKTGVKINKTIKLSADDIINGIDPYMEFAEKIAKQSKK